MIPFRYLERVWWRRIHPFHYVGRPYTPDMDCLNVSEKCLVGSKSRDYIPYSRELSFWEGILWFTTVVEDKVIEGGVGSRIKRIFIYRKLDGNQPCDNEYIGCGLRIQFPWLLLSSDFGYLFLVRLLKAGLLVPWLDLEYALLRTLLVGL
jgi:hypothetical protein